ncbi:hypothetical protein [Paenibacillus aestuarii]|uniref:WYL domain-containing protein n=1 Tax=Paenibacillus aestuarii TaxID=516965 RepID=A0ABW0KHX1_9BACL|nr:hypothetical protein [Paenibacillus aestuarii]
MNIKVKIPATPEQEDDLKRWLASIHANEINLDTKLLLKYDYFYANGWMNEEQFIKNHSGIRLRQWPEAKYLLRDNRICDLILRKLGVGGRRNLLAALQGFTTDVEISRLLGFKSSSQVAALLDPENQPNSFPGTITLLAKLLDITDEHITFEKILHVDNHYNNYHQNSSSIKLSNFYSHVGRSDREWFWIVNDLPYLKAKNLYARINTNEEYQSIEVYNLNENSVEVHDFRSCLDRSFSEIVITSAVLRNVKKVIYFRALTKNSVSLKQHLHELSLRKYTKFVP